MNVLRREYTSSYFDNWLLSEWQNSPRNRNRLKLLLKAKNCGKLLEIGCGKGRFLKLANKYFDIEGIDISAFAIHSIECLSSELIKIKNIEEDTILSNNYDVIAAFNLLEHLGKPSNVIYNIYNGLKERGVFVGSVPNNFGAIGGPFTSLTNFIDKTHCSTYSPSHWHRLFDRAGFKEIIFFGELLAGPNINFFIRNKAWKYLAFNLVFLCEK